MVVPTFMVTTFIVTFLVGFGGNLWVICSVLRSRKPRNSLSHMNTSDRLRSYISFLAGLDLTVVFPLLIRVAYVILPTATIDTLTCRFVFGLENFAKLASMTCLASISFERYITIRKPFNNKIRKHVIHLTPMVAMFVLSILLMAMALRIPDIENTPDEMNCEQRFNDSFLSHSTRIVLSSAYICLLLVISTSYFQIIRHVRRKFWQRKARVCANLRNNTLVAEPRYMREMTSAIMRVALFHVVCWLPYACLQFFPKSYGDVTSIMSTNIRQLPVDHSATIQQWIAFVANWLTYANAAGDWVFYAVMNRELRSLIRATTERRKRSTMSQQSSPSNLHQSLRRQVTQSIRFFHSINSYRSAGCSLDESVTLPGNGAFNGAQNNSSSNEQSNLVGRSFSSPKSSVFSNDVTTTTMPVVTSRYHSQATPRTSLLTADSVESLLLALNDQTDVIGPLDALSVQQLSKRVLGGGIYKCTVSSHFLNGSKQAFSSMTDSIQRAGNGGSAFFNFSDVGNDVFRAHHLRSGSGTQTAVYGGLLFSQALAAAGKTVSSEYLPNALHSMFLLSASPEHPIDYRVRRLRDGRSFCTRVVDAEQNGKVVFTCQISFHIKEKGAISHSTRMPDVPPPEELMSDVEGCRLFIQEEKDAKREIPKMQLIRMLKRVEEIEGDETVFEMRPTDLDAYFALKPMVPQPFYFWFKCSQKLPDDLTLHRLLACYITDSTLVSAAYRPHVSRGFVPSMMFSLDHNVWIHDTEFRADEWMLYEVTSSVAKNGRALSNAKFWTRDGRLVISAAQECLIRSRDSVSRL